MMSNIKYNDSSYQTNLSVAGQYWQNKAREANDPNIPSEVILNKSDVMHAHSHIKVMVVSDERTQRFAFDDTLRRAGFGVIGCFSIEQLNAFNLSKLPKGMVWLIDTPLSESLQSLIEITKPKTVLVGFNKSPSPHHEEPYQKWQLVLMRRLHESLGLSKTSKPKHSHAHPWRYVLFLGASTGGPDALKIFLDNLSPELPIAILIGHHFDKEMIHGLPKVLTRNNNWRCRMVSISQSLQSGLCLVAPIEQQIVCDSTGRVILLDKPWVGKYQPNLSQLLKNTSDVYGSELIGIIFSGMGDDGSAHLSEITQNKSHLWAQSPSSSACPSQPKAMIDSGFCQFVGTPVELANRVTHMLRGFKYKHLKFEEQG